jgi:stress response protein YsnF
VRETAEVPVVAKEARVVEEVVIGKEATERTETVRDTVRRTDVDVDELNREDTLDDVTTTRTTTNTSTDRPVCRRRGV